MNTNDLKLTIPQPVRDTILDRVACAGYQPPQTLDEWLAWTLDEMTWQVDLADTDDLAEAAHRLASVRLLADAASNLYYRGAVPATLPWDKPLAAVWHAKDIWDTHGPKPRWPDDYVLVANVRAGIPQEAYDLTQTVDHHWWEINQGHVVPCFEGEGCRSHLPCASRSAAPGTSAGDVVVLHNTPWFCDLFGWTDLPVDGDQVYLVVYLDAGVVTGHTAVTGKDQAGQECLAHVNAYLNGSRPRTADDFFDQEGGAFDVTNGAELEAWAFPVPGANGTGYTDDLDPEAQIGMEELIAGLIFDAGQGFLNDERVSEEVCQALGRQILQEVLTRFRADLIDDGRPANEGQIQLECTFWVPGPGLCGWTGSASEAGWCDHFQEWICPRCGASEGLGIIESKALPACVECRCPAQGTLPCGHPICDDCYEGLYQDGCAACNGHASWCRFSTEPPDTRPVHPIPDVAPDDHLEAAYEGRTELQHD